MNKLSWSYNYIYFNKCKFNIDALNERGNTFITDYTYLLAVMYIEKKRMSHFIIMHIKFYTEI
jgi:hypothetical protein